MVDDHNRGGVILILFSTLVHPCAAATNPLDFYIGKYCW